MPSLPQKRLVPRDNHRGFALVIVLAFVVLLIGVMLAFFSNSIGQRQVSSASANQAEVKLLADGAVDTVIGDLKAEIAAPANSVDVTGQLLIPPAMVRKFTCPPEPLPPPPPRWCRLCRASPMRRILEPLPMDWKT